MFLCHRDGRLQIGDEIINVSGTRLRGVSLQDSRKILDSSLTEVDIVVARSPNEQMAKLKQKGDSLDTEFRASECIRTNSNAERERLSSFNYPSSYSNYEMRLSFQKRRPQGLIQCKTKSFRFYRHRIGPKM